MLLRFILAGVVGETMMRKKKGEEGDIFKLDLENMCGFNRRTRRSTYLSRDSNSSRDAEKFRILRSA